jgi:branched-chain amino acid transport system ATP-binding protein
VPGGRPLLRVTELTVSFGGVTALADVDLTIDEGSLAGLVGPNGAGKTAFVDAISGVVRATSGTVTFGDRSFGRLSTSARARRGLVRTFADGQVFDDLTVRDNLMLAAQRARWWSVVADLVRPGRRSRAVEDQVDWAIGALGLERVADEVAGGLSHSTRKLVAIARALALRPKLLVLDEPATGLADADRQVLRSRLRDLPARGTTVLLVDHDLGLASDVCDTVHVLDLGVVIASGPPVVLSTNEAVLHAYLGSNGHTAPLAPPSAAAKVAVTAMTVGRDT